MRLFVTLLGVICIAAYAVGCGGGDDETITKAAYIKQGDAICVKAGTERDAALDAAWKAQKKTGEDQSPAFTKSLLSEVALPPLAQMTEELADLPDPDTGGEEAAAMVDSFEAGITQVEEEPNKVLNGANPFQKAEKQAAAFGFKACSQV